MPEVDWSRAPEGTTHMYGQAPYEPGPDGMPSSARYWEMWKDGHIYEWNAAHDRWDPYVSESTHYTLVATRIVRPSSVPVIVPLDLSTLSKDLLYFIK